MSTSRSRSIKIFTIFEGTSEVQRLVGRAVTGLPVR
jgi:alkylation response protein AidB-like acyl-CoA dehydrogenase